MSSIYPANSSSCQMALQCPLTLHSGAGLWISGWGGAKQVYLVLAVLELSTYSSLALDSVS